LATSTDSFGRLSVDAPSGVVRISVASVPGTKWATATDFDGRPVAHWVGGVIPPGASTPEIHFEAVGIPGILSYWAGGMVRFPSREEPEERDTVPDEPYTSQMVAGQTLGVEAWPADRSAASLLARLRDLTLRSCASPLLWVNSASLCSELTADLDQAESYRASGRPADAASSVATFSAALSGGVAGTFAPGVTSAGYWLLKSNADIVVLSF
jgi:hypothetical protein